MPTTTKPPGPYSFTASPVYLWLQQFGASNLYAAPSASQVTTETITALATDTGGNVYASGYDLGSLNGAPNPNQVAQNFIVKFSPTGALLWSNQFGTGSGDFLQSLGVDVVGNVYATGTTRGSLTGYANPNAIAQAAVYKFNSSGSLVWQKEFALDGGATEPTSLEIDPSGAVLLGGIFASGAASQGPQASELFFQKLDGTSGSLMWQVTFGVDTTDSLQQLTCDTSGDLYAVGTTTGSFPGKSTGSGSPFLLKLAGTTGSLVWVVSPVVSGMSNIVPFSLAAANGAIVVGGAATNQEIVVGPQVNSGEEGFLASFSTATGSTNWTKAISSGQGDALTGITVASNGDIFAVGDTNGVFAAGFSQPFQDFMLLQFAEDGTDLTALQFGTGPIVNQTAAVGPRIISSSTGQIYVGGPVQTPFPGFTNPPASLEMFISRVQ